MANRFDTTVRESTDLLETGLKLLEGMLLQVHFFLKILSM